MRKILISAILAASTLAIAAPAAAQLTVSVGTQYGSPYGNQYGYGGQYGQYDDFLVQGDLLKGCRLNLTSPGRKATERAGASPAPLLHPHGNRAP